MKLYLRGMVLFSCFFSFSDVCFSDSILIEEVAAKDWKTELSEIDAELKRMEEEQERLKLSYARWSDAGSRWQFQQGMTQEAKRAFEKADADKAQMDKNQIYIDALKSRRAKILKQHPEANDIQRPS